VDVLDEEHRRCLRAQRAEDLDGPRQDQREMRVSGRSARRRGRIEALAERVDPGAKRAGGDGDPSEQVAEEPVRDPMVELVGAAGDRSQPLLLTPSENLGGQPRLADAGVASDQQACGAAVPDLVQLVEREGELLLASDELRRLAQV
jgi:hypothetical protein